MRGNRVLVYIALVLAGAGAVALYRRSRRAAPPPARAAGPAVVVSHEITLQGKIRPQHVISIAVPLTGLVEGLPVDVGQEVYQDQVLARVGAQLLESARQIAV